VLDCWALLEYVFDQPGARKVEGYLGRADAGDCRLLMSWINAGESVYMTARKKGAKAASALGKALVESLPIELILPEADNILAAARIKAAAKVAYGDAFALELARHRRAPIITGDPEIRDYGGAEVIWIGPGRA
jgi:predicted nucleic acid-binding protein